ncbi:hypothetical protein HYALB_00002602 [Hymenoscyphus albidus]|uniref:Uncharacterized protein n=1 Tax=Hymenoscyphus albidus TaxID=595503 RepID=A0A9N9Q4V6_9HELO|nr:hypothetical protein HYALB_00002602 [Hymenoscyphus albidus]
MEGFFNFTHSFSCPSVCLATAIRTMRFQSTFSNGILASSLPVALGWGSLGHQTVAYVATNFVNELTKAKFQTILGDTTSDYLASIATFADSYRYTEGGEFTSPYHYIDAMDSPPETCGVDFERDCPEEGCIVSAISNYSSSLSEAEVLFAAKGRFWRVGNSLVLANQCSLSQTSINLFINLAVGGNTILVTFDGAATNLHAVWDTSIPQKFAGSATLAHAHTFAANLTDAIQTGVYKNESATWLKGIDLSVPVETAMLWAVDANAFVCTAVIPEGPNVTTTIDLGGEYYRENIPVVQRQLAKAGYRLAKWLDLIAASTA